MPPTLFPVICTSLRGLTHLRLRDYSGYNIVPDLELISGLGSLTHLHLRPSVQDSQIRLNVLSFVRIYVLTCVYR